MSSGEFKDSNRPLPSSPEFEIIGATTFAIDQVIVDGLEERVKFSRLARIAFQATTVGKEVVTAYQQCLAQDDRYIDRLKNLYTFEPVVSHETTARASYRAIIAGRARCGQEEKGEVLNLMNQFAEVVYQSSGRSVSILSDREVSGILGSAGFHLNYQEYGGFREYIKVDPRFKKLGDGRVVLVEKYKGEIDKLEEMPRIENVSAAVTDALPYIFLNNGEFKGGALLGTIKARGQYVRADQVREVFRALASHPEVTPLSDGHFKYHGKSQHSNPSKEEHTNPESEEYRVEMSLDEMIRATIGHRSSKARKPRSRKNGGISRKTRRM